MIVNSVVENIDTLKKVLSNTHKLPILDVAFDVRELQGGTVASVYLVEGTFVTPNKKQYTFKVVLKKQKKWERYRDSLSWRREFDLYSSNMTKFFTDSFRWPNCYHAEMNPEENQSELWLEYIDGITSVNLNKEMLEKAAYELGQFQGRVYSAGNALSLKLSNLSAVNYVKSFYEHYRSWPEVHDYIRSENSEIPEHICEMLIDFDNNAEHHFLQIEKLPKVFCHRDYWIANIFCKDNKIIVIDWDTAGWGYIGEDLASLIADEADNEHIIEYFDVLVSAYYKGFSDQVGISLEVDHIVEFILAMFGYRLVEWFLQSDTTESKSMHLETLEKFYEINTTMGARKRNSENFVSKAVAL